MCTADFKAELQHCTYRGDNGGCKDDRVAPVPRVAVIFSTDGHTLACSFWHNLRGINTEIHLSKKKQKNLQSTASVVTFPDPHWWQTHRCGCGLSLEKTKKKRKLKTLKYRWTHLTQTFILHRFSGVTAWLCMSPSPLRGLMWISNSNGEQWHVPLLTSEHKRTGYSGAMTTFRVTVSPLTAWVWLSETNTSWNFISQLSWMCRISQWITGHR